MNLITNKKINLLTDKLVQLESRILHSSIERSDQNYRVLIDARRQLLADIIEERQATQASNINLKGSDDVDRFIDSLNSTSLRENCTTIDFQIADFCN